MSPKPDWSTRQAPGQARLLTETVSTTAAMSGYRPTEIWVTGTSRL